MASYVQSAASALKRLSESPHLSSTGTGLFSGQKTQPSEYARENVQPSYFPSVGALVGGEKKKREIKSINHNIQALSVVLFLSLQKSKRIEKKAENKEKEWYRNTVPARQ